MTQRVDFNLIQTALEYYQAAMNWYNINIRHQEPAPLKLNDNQAEASTPEFFQFAQKVVSFFKDVYSLATVPQVRTQTATLSRNFSSLISSTASPSRLRYSITIPNEEEKLTIMSKINNVMDVIRVTSTWFAKWGWYGTAFLLGIHVLTRFFSLLSFISLIAATILGFSTYDFYQLRDSSLLFKRKLTLILGPPQGDLQIKEENARATAVKRHVQDGIFEIEKLQRSTYFLSYILPLNRVLENLRFIETDIPDPDYLPSSLPFHIQ
jgi:hypothetical protein